MLLKSLVVITWKSEPTALPLVLVLQLNPGRGGFWQSVTGRVDENESHEDCALREAHEETGLRFERRPQFLGFEYEFKGSGETPMREKTFWLPIVGGAAPPVPRLDPSEHSAYQWLPAAEAVALVKFEGNKKAIARATSGLPPLFLSTSGVFFQEGEEISHERTAELLHRSLRRTGGNYFVRIGTEELDVVVADTPRFVRSFDAASGQITTASGDVEPLDPTSLKIRADDSMVCQLRDGLEARLLSGAYYELTKSVRQGSGGEYILHFGGRDYRLAIPSQGEGVDR